uniref:CABIT domain-containing protein n=1 Tax=Varanus komodoensis TaxID=61221 RepID=A0A8D2J437_VARKO
MLYKLHRWPVSQQRLPHSALVSSVARVMDSVSFHNYICDLDHNSLPRVVKICSGVYFQGSVYELWGNECCLSTGDLMKIVDVQLQNVICQNVEGEDRFELPPDFKGMHASCTIVPGQVEIQRAFCIQKGSGS